MDAVGKVRIRVPYKFVPRKYQQAIVDFMDTKLPLNESGEPDEGHRAVCVWHRRSGKDKTFLNIMIKKMVEEPGIYYYFFPTYAQAKKAIWDGMDKNGLPFLAHFPKELITSLNNTEMKIKLSNGSLFQLIGTENTDLIVGTNPRGCVFSEYSLQDPDAWNFVRPILAENKGWAIFNFTPRGMNHAHSLYSQALENMKTKDNWFCQLLTVDDTKVLSNITLETESQAMPLDLFEQEYHCRFIEGAGAFFRIPEDAILIERPKENKSFRFQCGVDLAKYQDWTVLTPLCLNNFYVYPQERFNQIDWNLQKSRIEAFSYKYGTNGKAKIVVDATGLGDPIVDDLRMMGLNVEPFKFTYSSKKDLLNNLSIMLSEGRIKLPADDGLLNELRSFKYELTERGKLQLGVPDGMTDDRVMSLALACWQAIRIKQSDVHDWFRKIKKVNKDTSSNMFHPI